jgi:beta-glucosidase-like glycosyl hydrolase
MFRGQETPGEDPTLNGIYGAEFVRGFQGAGPVPPNATGAAVHYEEGEGAAFFHPVGADAVGADDSADADVDTPLMASSCAKHFFG